MITKKQMNLSPRKISGWLTAIIVFSTTVVLIIISIFLYKNFYRIISQTKEIIILQEKVALYSVNIEKFDSIIDKLAKKTLPKKIDNIISPFQ